MPPVFINPYLGLRARYTLVPFNTFVIPFAFVALSLATALASIRSAVAASKAQLLASCTSAEKAASLYASRGHYTAAATNRLIAGSATGTIRAMAFALNVAIQSVAAIINFAIDLYRSIFLCLADLVVRSGLTFAISASEAMSSLIQSAASGIRTALQESLTGLNTALASAISIANRLPGVNIDTPSIDIPDFAALTDVRLPDSVTESLVSLNSSMPTLDDMRERLQNTISIPFNNLRAEINGTLGNATFDAQLLPLPAKQDVAFCEDMDVSFVDDVGNALRHTIKISFILLAVIFALVIIFHVLLARHQYRRLVRNAEEYENSPYLYQLSSSPRSFLLTLLSISQQPFLFRSVDFIVDRSAKSRSSVNTRTRLYWFTAYITHPPALAILLAGVIGLIAVQLQFAAMDAARKHAVNIAQAGLNDTQQSIVSQINAAIANSTEDYVQGVNTRLADFEEQMNSGVLLHIASGTEALNTTINAFYTEITDAITLIFGSGPLAAPAQGIVGCILGSKVEAISAALTFLNENARVSLSRVSDTIFQIDTADTATFAQSLQGDTSSDASTGPSIVRRIFDVYQEALEKQRFIALILLAIYGLVLVFALIGCVSSQVALAEEDKAPSISSTTYTKPLRLATLSAWKQRLIHPDKKQESGTEKRSDLDVVFPVSCVDEKNPDPTKDWVHPQRVAGWEKYQDK